MASAAGLAAHCTDAVRASGRDTGAEDVRARGGPHAGFQVSSAADCCFACRVVAVFGSAIFILGGPCSSRS